MHATMPNSEYVTVIHDSVMSNNEHIINIPCKSPIASETKMAQMADLNQESSANTTLSVEQLESNGKRNAATIPRKKGIFDEGWAAKTFDIMPFTFITNLFAALWGVNGGIELSSCTYKIFFFLLMINFYLSVIGILIWHMFPMVAKGFHLMAFLCAMLSLTILFCAVAPGELKCMPWIFMTLVLLVVVGLLVYELSSLSKKPSLV